MTQESVVVKPLSAVFKNPSNAGVRFTLKKRPIRNNKDMVNLSSYNSDFLSGLFADVAKATVLSDLELPPKRSAELISPDPAQDLFKVSPQKKSRTSLTRCFSKALPSTMNLNALGVIKSPKGVNEVFGSGDRSSESKLKTLAEGHQHDSLAFQLSCVSESSETGFPCSSVGDAAKLAFPNLPATVSDSSCTAGLTRANLVRHVSTPENEPKESFGWFVDLDDNHTIEVRPGLPYAVSCDDLAFQAPTAPKGVCNDAELEWAQAADTVDDVLGDFF